MYVKIVLLSALLGLVAASPAGAPASPAAPAPAAPPTVSQCNTGSIQCCNSIESASNSGTASLLHLLGVAVGSVTAQVGLGCTPISVIGLGQGANCAQQPACCTGNNYYGLVNLDCTPIST